MPKSAKESINHLMGVSGKSRRKSRATRKASKTLVTLGVVAAVGVIGYFAVYAASLSVSDTYDDETMIASKSDVEVSGGQVMLDNTWNDLTEERCNSVDGWYWYTTNERSACWSKSLVDSISWNKGVGNDTDNPGAYTCATDLTYLKDRMRAAADGEWYKIVSDVNSVTITSDHNGQAGASSLSALAIADCIDGTRDLCTGDGCLGADSGAVKGALATWATAAGEKSALPYCSDPTCDNSINNDFRNACEQTPNYDYPLDCELTAVFYKNQKVCNDGDTDYTWAAAASSTTYARLLGAYACSRVNDFGTSVTGSDYGFRVVLRP